MEEEVVGQKKESSKARPGKGVSLKSILGGDMLDTAFLKRQTKLLVLVVLLTILYIDCRYSCQREQITIEELKVKLVEVKYNALTRSSELMERSRQSRIEEYISEQGIDLETSTTPPYLIKK